MALSKGVSATMISTCAPFVLRASERFLRGRMWPPVPPPMRSIFFGGMFNILFHKGRPRRFQLFLFSFLVAGRIERCLR